MASMKNLRYVKYPEDPDAPDIMVRKLTAHEKDLLIEQLLEGMGGDRLSDLLADVATQATNGEADTIVWD